MPGPDCCCIRQERLEGSTVRGGGKPGPAKNRSKKEEAFPASGWVVFDLGFVRQFAALKSRERIVVKKSFGFLHAKLRRNQIIGWAQFQRAGLGVVRVAGRKVHDAFIDPAKKIFLRVGAKGSGKRVGGDLDVAA